MSEKWSTLNILQHVRHDWLNRIQLIKGNIALGKQENAEKIIDQIVKDMEHETRLTNLKLPEFSMILYTHNWEGHKFRLDYEVLNKWSMIVIDDQQLADWTHSLFSALNESFDPFFDNSVQLTIVPDSEIYRFLFTIHGILDDKQLEQWISKQSYPEELNLHKISRTEWQILAMIK